jgi:hypothetical protein
VGGVIEQNARISKIRQVPWLRWTLNTKMQSAKDANPLRLIGSEIFHAYVFFRHLEST